MIPLGYFFAKLLVNAIRYEKPPEDPWVRAVRLRSAASFPSASSALNPPPVGHTLYIPTAERYQGITIIVTDSTPTSVTGCSQSNRWWNRGCGVVLTLSTSEWIKTFGPYVKPIQTVHH